VLLNPFGGAGIADSNWETKARPLLEYAHMDITVRYTERAKHAQEICKNQLQQGQYDCIVAVSGDGLIHEIINGLMNRKDWPQFKDTVTLGFIQGGTGNGLVSSILKQSGEELCVEEASFIVAKGRRMHMDLTEIDAEYDGRIYSFLSTAWAVVADCDVNSEMIRCIGEARWTLWGIMRVILMKNYFGTLDFKGFYVKNKHQYEDSYNN